VHDEAEPTDSTDWTPIVGHVRYRVNGRSKLILDDRGRNESSGEEDHTILTS
jgi:hypothetical protein